MNKIRGILLGFIVWIIYKIISLTWRTKISEPPGMRQDINQKKGNDLVLDLVHSNLKKTHADWPIETHNQLLTWWRHTQQYRFGTNKTIHNPKEHLRELESLLLTLDRHDYV